MSNWKTNNPPLGEYIQIQYLAGGENLRATVARLVDGIYHSIDPTDPDDIYPVHVQAWRHLDESDQYLEALNVLDAIFELIETGELKPNKPSAVWAFRFAKQNHARIRANHNK